jgi:arylsulfatase A-like enzyme
MRVAAMLHWIDGKDCGGKRDAPVPVVMGISFSAVGEAKMTTANNGYADATGTPATELASALESVDNSIATIVRELKTKNLFDSTWIVVTASYGRAPLTARSIRTVNLSALKAVAESVPHAVVSHISGSGSATVWLKDSSMTALVTKALSAKASLLGIEEVVTGERLGLTMNLPAEDSRMPDIILRSRSDVRWVPAGRGSATDEDAHVALLVSGVQLTGRLDKTPVPTTQLPPLLLRALGMEKFDLQALHREHSPALPGIF